MIVVGGETLVDLVTREAPGVKDAGLPEVLAHLAPALGGGPFNVAIAAGRQGAPVRFLTAMSRDLYGQAARRALEGSGVGLELIQDSGKPTSLAMALTGADGAARYTFYVEGTADRAVEDPGPLPAETTLACFGTLSLVLEPGASAYEAVMRREASRGTAVCLDPNIRAALIEDPAAYRARFESWLPELALLKLSDDDASWLADGADPGEAARGWAGRGPAAVVLTRGADGLEIYLAGREPIRIPGVSVTVADTIGAGDTVMGTLVTRLHALVDAHRSAHPELTPREAAVRVTPEEWKEAAERANVAAAINTSRHGANPPTDAEISAYLAAAPAIGDQTSG